MTFYFGDFEELHDVLFNHFNLTQNKYISCLDLVIYLEQVKGNKIDIKAPFNDSVYWWLIGLRSHMRFSSNSPITLGTEEQISALEYVLHNNTIF